MKWLNTIMQKRYALEVLRELLSASIQQAIDAEVGSRQHKIALRRWADARDAEWTEMSPKDQASHRSYSATDKRLHDYVSGLKNEVTS